MRCFWLLLLGFSFSLQAQNLVSNSSFEELINLPVKPNPRNTFEYEPNSGFEPFRKNLKFWFAGSLTTPDLRIFSSDYYRNCDKLFDDCDRPRTGHMMVGIITSMTNTYTDSYREYIQIKLNKPLKPKERTFVEFWVRKEREAKLVSNNIGVHFSMDRVFEKTEEVVKLKPQINYDSLVNEKESKWVKISGSFVPARPYQFVLIGNFFENKHTQTAAFEDYSASPYIPPYAYYLVDDVRIWQPSTPKVEAPDLPLNKAIVLENIHFETDSFNLEQIAIPELEKLFEFLQRDTTLQAAIYGHTDDQADDDYNIRLSQKRATSVVQYLIDKGINRERLQAVGFGESQPKASNETPEGRRENRRVEFMLLE